MSPNVVLIPLIWAFTKFSGSFPSIKFKLAIVAWKIFSSYNPILCSGVEAEETSPQ